MNINDLESLAQKTREDGARLFGVCELIYKISLVFLWLLGIIGVILTIFILSQIGFIAALATGLSFAFFILIGYAFAVLTTHVSKVLVHTSFASIAIAERITQQPILEPRASFEHKSNQNDFVKTSENVFKSAPDIVPNEKESNEVDRLLERLESHGYRLKTYDRKIGKWIVSNGSEEFSQSAYELRDLLRKFEK
jgi:hypothetical protein